MFITVSGATKQCNGETSNGQKWLKLIKIQTIDLFKKELAGNIHTETASFKIIWRSILVSFTCVVSLAFLLLIMRKVNL